MPYEVRFSSAADRRISKLPQTIRPLIIARAEALADDPRPHGVEKISGEENAYRIRVGDYRIIYEIHDAV
jgi:mRNA interferase RelE/StbE